MPDNYQIADMFSLLSKLMDIHGEDSFKAKTYAAAAFNIEKLPVQLADVEPAKISTYKGVGASTSKKILEILQTGELKALTDIVARTPPGVIEMLSIKGIGPIAAIFLIVFGGIYGGFFTPTEGAAVGAFSTFVAALLKREMTWDKFKKCFYATAESSAMIFLIFLGADLMNASLALTQVPSQLAQLVGSWGLSPVMVVAAIMLFYVVLGAVMDELSMILLTIPIFFPMIMGLDFGMSKEYTAIWFGIMVLMTVGFGMLAPPVGLNVYVVNSMTKGRGKGKGQASYDDVPISESYKGVMPFLISDVFRTLLLLFFPGVSLWLVKYVS